MKRLVLLLSAFLVMASVFAQSSNRISDLEKKRKAALDRIEETSRMLNKNKTTTKNSLYKLNVLSDKIKARERFLGEISNELTGINKDVDEIKGEYTDLSRQLSVKKEQYAKSLRLMSRKNKSEDKLMFLLSSSDLNQLGRRIRYLNEYSDFQKVQAIEITRKQEELNQKRIALEKIYHEKKTVKDKQEHEKSILDKEKNQQSLMIKDLKSKEKLLVSEINKQKKLADKLNKQIENIIAEEAKKAAAAAAKEKNRTAETKGGYAMTQQEKQLSGDFSKNQGILPLPISQPGSIIVHYGEQKYQELKYVQNSSKGIDIQTSQGASARAVFDGVVSKVFALPGFNNSIIVRHGNYLSVYANLSTINVKTGDKVKTGQSLGKIFTDSQQNNLTVLHFQLWKDTQRLNPETWLRK
jgi:septal ring factor EnvC (AmiA/AmiB activator)